MTRRITPDQKSRVRLLFSQGLNATTISKRMGLKFDQVRDELERAHGTHFARDHKNPATARLHSPDLHSHQEPLRPFEVFSAPFSKLPRDVVDSYQAAKIKLIRTVKPPV